MPMRFNLNYYVDSWDNIEEMKKKKNARSCIDQENWLTWQKSRKTYNSQGYLLSFWKVREKPRNSKLETEVDI